MYPKVFSRMASAQETSHAANSLIHEARRQAAELGVELTEFQVQVVPHKDVNFLVVVVAKGSWAHEESQLS
jgi:hypothetical protein